MRSRKDGVETRKQILDAAILEFSQKGFRDTTIADICRVAGTNIASVNYHFGDKQRLYAESWRQAFQYSHELHPSAGGVAPDAPAEERLRGWIVSFVRRLTDPACHDLEIAHKEMANPTGLLVETMREALDRMRQELSSILRELLGGKASDEDIEMCEMSIRSQCMNPMVLGKRHKPQEGAIPPPPGLPSLDVDPERIASHVVRFSLAGVGEARRHLETRKRLRKKPRC
jgi:TetR/AcrR family transcriptional regulator, regulator of cefoperazone and chloramphenicol sensitivity